MEEPVRGLTVHFIDGTKVAFSFPRQEANAAARSLRLEESIKSPFLFIIADGVLNLLPMANIKAIQVPFAEQDAEGMRLPMQVIRNATLIRGDL